MIRSQSVFVASSGVTGETCLRGRGSKSAEECDLTVRRERGGVGRRTEAQAPAGTSSKTRTDPAGNYAYIFAREVKSVGFCQICRIWQMRFRNPLSPHPQASQWKKRRLRNARHGQIDVRNIVIFSTFDSVEFRTLEWHKRKRYRHPLLIRRRRRNPAGTKQSSRFSAQSDESLFEIRSSFTWRA